VRVAVVLLCLLHGGIAAADEGQKDRGFAFDVHLGTRLVDLAGVANIGSVSGGFFAGYKIGRVIFGVGLNLSRFADSRSVTNTTVGEADTSFLFVPGVQVAIVRSADKRVELYGEFDLGLGTSIHTEDPAPTNEPDRTVFLLNYRLGPGVRFWLHPQFAINMLVGVAGDFSFETVSMGNSSVRSSAGVTSIFTNLGAMGVF
jgi:hypothetical protein